MKKVVLQSDSSLQFSSTQHLSAVFNNASISTSVDFQQAGIRTLQNETKLVIKRFKNEFTLRVQQ